MKGLRYMHVLVVLLVGLVAVTGAFLVGGVSQQRSYWPFGGRYPILESLLAQVGRVERKLAPVERFLRKQINTGLHPIIVEAYQLPFKDSGPTGPFQPLSDTEFLVATKRGELHHVVIGNEKADATLIGSLGVSEKVPPLGGVKDLLLVAPQLLLVSMNTWNQQKSCFALGLFEFSVDIQQRSLKQGRKLFESEPCAPPDVGAHMSGGRMIRFSDDSILLTIGDLDTDSLVDGRKTNLARIHKIDLRDGSSTVFALGTRNAMGLFLDEESHLLFETEHGPRGGDEVNLIQQGKHYGWPHATYGTAYSNPYEKLLTTSVPKWGDHSEYEQPLLAFVPDIGINNLIRYPTRGTEFPGWRGDLLVGSLLAQTLYRLRYVDGRILYSEPILLEERLRDIALLPNGSIAIKTDSQKVLLLTRAMATSGG